MSSGDERFDGMFLTIAQQSQVFKMNAAEARIGQSSDI
jgi:hypothetical protein